MRFSRYTVYNAATILVWIVGGLDLTPLLALPPAADLYLVAAGCVGSYGWIARSNARPVEEVFQAGYMLGLREGGQLAASRDVVPIASRGLRAVGGRG